MTALGDSLELTIEDLTVEGGGLARHEGRVIFTDKGLPGERVLARLTRVKPRFALAAVEKTLVPSPTAQPPHCPHAGICGGCAWPGLPYAEELAWKERQLRETLRRVGKVEESLLADPDVFLPIIPSPAVSEYRNKLEFAFGLAPGAGPDDGAALGLRLRGSHDVLEVEHCPLAAFPHRELLETVRAWAGEEGLAPWKEGGKGSGFLRHLVLRRSGASCIVELITAPCAEKSPEQKAVERLAATLRPEAQPGGQPGGQAEVLCAGFIHSLRSSPSAVAYGEARRFERGETVMEETLAGTIFRAPVPAFLQVNTAAASLLYETAREFARAGGEEGEGKPGGGILDLYCGVGGLAVTLAAMPEFRDTPVTGVDTMGVAIAAARENALRAGVSPRFETADSAACLEALREAPGLVAADPPRAGLPADLVDSLLRLRPARILLVSCNPATLARDVAGLGDAYLLRRARGVDLFPRAAHMESVLLLERRPG